MSVTSMLGLIAALLIALASPALAEDETEQIQETEEPGSEIKIEIPVGGGNEPATIERGDSELQLPADPATPETDPIDEELPGEGPEDLSGPDDDDPLPE